jgi:hypothetical protein
MLRHLILFAFGPLVACTPTKLIVLLVDTSPTIPRADSTLYLESAARVIRSLQPGDRIVVAAIGNQSRSTYRAELDHDLPRTGVSLDDDEARDSVLRLIEARVASLIGERNPGESNVLDAVSFAADIFEQDQRPIHELILLSDGLHESQDYNLRTQPINSGFAGRVIRDRKAIGAFPRLDSTHVLIVGAGGSTHDAARYGLVRSFWLEYLTVAGATVDAYGRIPAAISQRW